MKMFQNEITRFEPFHAQVLGISADTPKTHEAFAASLGLTFPLVTDNGSIRKQYGSGRITHLIDAQGFIRYRHEGMPQIERLLQELAELTPQ